MTAVSRTEGYVFMRIRGRVASQARAAGCYSCYSHPAYFVSGVARAGQPQEGTRLAMLGVDCGPIASTHPPVPPRLCHLYPPLASGHLFAPGAHCGGALVLERVRQ